MSNIPNVGVVSPRNAFMPPQNAVLPPPQNAVLPQPQNAAPPPPHQVLQPQNVVPLDPPGVLAPPDDQGLQGQPPLGQGPGLPGGQGGQGPAAAVLGNGMNNVHMNANFAMNLAAMADHRASLAMQACGTLAKAQIKADRWSRDLKINQEKAKFRAPADKKAVSYFVEEKFDLKELL